MDRDINENVVDPEERKTPSTGQSDYGSSGDQRGRDPQQPPHHTHPPTQPPPPDQHPHKPQTNTHNHHHESPSGGAVGGESPNTQEI
jgi:hypothetical protein